MPAPIAPLVVGGLIDAGMKLIERLFPDPQQKATAQLELLRLQQTGELAQLQADVQLAMGQMQVNAAEATAGAFRGGWRPMVGWICAAGLGYQVVLRPLLMFAAAVNGTPVEAPSIELDTLLTLLFGMLGLGAFRTYEKAKGLP